VTLLALFYILLADNVFDPLKASILVLIFGFYFMCGFLINDFFDRSSDIKAGKVRAVQELPREIFIGIILAWILVILLFLWYLNNIFFTVMYCVSFFLGTLYSTPLIRFKERGFVGIIINALTEKALPVLMIFIFFNHFGIDTLIFVVTTFLLQTIEIMTHQIYDYDADLKTRTRTYVIDVGKEKALKLFSFLIVPLSLVFILLLCSLIALKIPFAGFIIVIVGIVYLVITILVKKGRLHREEKILPLYMSPLYLLINNAFPLLLALLLIYASPQNILLLAAACASQYYLFKQLFIVIRDGIITRIEIADT
jgi:4-hydroxybenzoate polyprenyltransferase